MTASIMAMSPSVPVLLEPQAKKASEQLSPVCQHVPPSHDIVLTSPVPAEISADPHGARRVYALISRLAIGWESLPWSCLPCCWSR